MAADITQKLAFLQPKPIDSSKCDPNKSLYWQIIRNNQTTLNRQAKQFNLGNSVKFNPLATDGHYTDHAVNVTEIPMGSI